ncbi:MAG TPA: LytTR family DNA-binding domain-containing protein, partial [Bacteroidia bacterium]|jgi:two-component system LytT family response regulator
VVGMAATATDAVKVILKERPDAVFLDIQMPGYNGFDVLDQVRNHTAHIVFTTAHRDFAIQAIKKGAFDYLLKPVDEDDLRECVGRLRKKLAANQTDYSVPVQVSMKDGVVFIDPKEIIKLQASGSYTDIFFDNNTRITASKVLKEFESLLDPKLFYRCHNSFLVNLSKIKKLLSQDGYFIEFKDGSKAEVSKKNKDELLIKMRSFPSK